MNSLNLKKSLAAAAAASALLMTAACGASDDSETASDTASTPSAAATSDSASEDTSSDSDDTSSDASGAFAAGEYEASGDYVSPGGTQTVEVELTLESDGTITELEVDGQADSGNSAVFQKKFEEGINDLVVGKKITELNVSKVSGSSLTSEGFNAAIDDIISQAQA